MYDRNINSTKSKEISAYKMTNAHRHIKDWLHERLYDLIERARALVASHVFSSLDLYDSTCIFSHHVCEEKTYFDASYA